MLIGLVKIFIFPGLIFLIAFSLFASYLDRKLYARLQNRKGPGWHQPLADILKLLGKESIIPDSADKNMFSFLPVAALTAIVAAYLYIPLWGQEALYWFEGDLIVVLYLLTIPTLCFFLAGWYSRSIYATLGSVRVLTQFFSYEVPLFMAFLAPALLANTWSLSGITAYYHLHPIYALINIPAFVVTLIAGQGKLQRVPFDMPEAETEIVAGPFVEYSGRLYAVFKLALQSEFIVVISLISAVFMPFYTGSIVTDFLLYFVKVLFILVILCVMRTTMARIRVDQMVQFCWRYLAPVAMVQVVVNLLLKGVLA